MIRLPPRSTRTYTHCPHTTLFRAGVCRGAGVESSALSDGAVVVEHAAEIDVLLVVHPDHVSAHRLADLPAPVPLDAVDPLATVGRINGLGEGDRVGDAATAAQLRLLGTVQIGRAHV